MGARNGASFDAELAFPLLPLEEEEEVCWSPDPAPPLA